MYNPSASIQLKKFIKRLRREKVSGENFEFRLSMQIQDLHRQFYYLYGTHANPEEKFYELVKTLAEKYSERSAKLRKRDEKRESEPGWFRDQKLAGMVLYADRFAGNIQGVQDKIDYFQELGVNVIHLMPLLNTPEGKSDGGYAVSDYTKTNPRLGTNKDLLKLISALHNNEMLVVLDLVVNHTSDEHEWAVKAREGSTHYRDYFYTFEDRMVPDIFEQHMPEVFPENAPGNFTWSEEMKRWVMTVFNQYQWDLNYTNPDVFQEMLSILLLQANWGVDIFRMDAVAFLWKQTGTTSQNLPNAHAILKLFRVCSRIVAPGVALLAEAIVAPDEIINYFGKSDEWSNECDLAYNASLMTLLWDTLATKNSNVISAAYRLMPTKPAGTSWVNYIRCHDDIGLGYDNRHIKAAGYEPLKHRQFLVEFLTGEFEGSFPRGLPFMVNKKTGDARISGSLASLAGLEEENSNGEMAVRRILMLHGVIFAWGGIPMIYYGDELATLNDYTYLEDPLRMDDNRWVHRPVYDWSKTKELIHSDTPSGKVFSGLRHMLSVRKNLSLLADNEPTRLTDAQNRHVLAFARRSKQKCLLVLANLTPDVQQVGQGILHYLRIDLYGLIDELEGEPPAMDAHGFILKPYQLMWLVNGKKTSE